MLELQVVQVLNSPFLQYQHLVDEAGLLECLVQIVVGHLVGHFADKYKHLRAYYFIPLPNITIFDCTQYHIWNACETSSVHA